MDRYVRPSIESDVAFIADHMRVEDVEEVRAAGSDPLNSLTFGLHHSKPCLTLLNGAGTPIAMCGVAPGAYPNSGAIWLLGTQGIEDSSITFLRYSKQALELMFDQSGAEFTYNYTYAENHLHHRWLKWLGFTFLRRVSLGPEGKPFYEFVKLGVNDV